MSTPVPYWKNGADYSKVPFFIRKLSSGGGRVPSIPTASIPIEGFLYLTGGEVLVEAGGESYLCVKDDILLIPEGVPFSINFHSTCSGFCGGFSIHLLKNIPYKVLQSGKPVQYRFPEENSKLISELFSLMERSFMGGEGQMIVKALDIILPLVGEPRSPFSSPYVGRFLEMIFDRNSTPQNAGYYAGELGITLNYLNKIVHQQTGKTATSWIDISRVNMAKNLLQDKNIPIIDVAVAVGLDDQSYFSRFFKKLTGLTPSEYRKTF